MSKQNYNKHTSKILHSTKHIQRERKRKYYNLTTIYESGFGCSYSTCSFVRAVGIKQGGELIVVNERELIRSSSTSFTVIEVILMMLTIIRHHHVWPNQ